MQIKNTSNQNIEGFQVGDDKCDFPAGEINTVPELLGKAALEKYHICLEEIPGSSVIDEPIAKPIQKTKSSGHSFPKGLVPKVKGRPEPKKKIQKRKK